MLLRLLDEFELFLRKVYCYLNNDVLYRFIERSKKIKVRRLEELK